MSDIADNPRAAGRRVRPRAGGGGRDDRGRARARRLQGRRDREGPLLGLCQRLLATKYDEWGIMYKRKFDHPLPLFTYTMRNNTEQFALPVRRYTTDQSSPRATASAGWPSTTAALMGRFGPWVYQMQSETASSTGRLPERHPAHQRHRGLADDLRRLRAILCGVREGLGRHRHQPGPVPAPEPGLPAPTAPIPPSEQSRSDACEAWATTHTPRPQRWPRSLHQPVWGPVNACVYDGWCGETCNYVCEIGAKANSAYRTIPAAMKTGTSPWR